MTKFHQNWFKHFVETLDNVFDRKKLKNLRETEHRRIACACVKKSQESNKLGGIPPNLTRNCALAKGAR